MPDYGRATLACIKFLFFLFFVLLVLGCNRRAAEFQKADQAISQARGWRMNATHPQIPGLEPNIASQDMVKLRIEAIPPDREYVWQERMLQDNLVHFEYIRIGEENYIRGDDVTPHPVADWVPVKANQVFFQVNAMLQFRMKDPFDRKISTNISDLLDVSDLRDLGLRTYEGHTCREWAGTHYGPDMPSYYKDTVCLGTADHLPYHVHLEETKFDATYEWNPDISISAPEIGHATEAH